MHPLERLVNLVALLLESRRPLTFEQIRAKMPEGYGQADRHDRAASQPEAGPFTTHGPSIMPHRCTRSSVW